MSSITNNKDTPIEKSARYIITGGPGAGKTTLLRALQEKGEAVIAEAATDVITRELEWGVSEPWVKEGFREKIIALQEERQQAALALKSNRVFFDRSPIDTLSYCLRFQAQPTEILQGSVQQILDTSYYDKIVFLVKNLGDCQSTEVRCEGQEESLLMESILETNYRERGFNVIFVEAGTVEERVNFIINTLNKKV